MCSFPYRNRGFTVYQAVAAVFILASTPGHAFGQYSIEWSSIDCGGTTDVSDGTYTLGGTVGQFDASAAITDGTYQITGGYWADAAPVSAFGACCLPAQVCIISDAINCPMMGGTYMGDEVNCTAGLCGGGCACLGDLNSDAAVNGRDIRAFVNCVVSGDPGCNCGDFNHSGDVTQADVSGAVTAFLTGQCGP